MLAVQSRLNRNRSVSHTIPTNSKFGILPYRVSVNLLIQTHEHVNFDT